MKKVALVLGYLTLAYLVFFWPTLRGDTILESGNDARRFGYPVRVYLSEQLRDGKFPFWTERMLSGYPIYADLEAGYLNPVNLILVYLFGPFTSYKVMHFLSYLLGSFCFLLFLKSQLKSSSGVIVTHFIYFFSFFSLYHQQHFGITFGFLLFPCFLHLLKEMVVVKKSLYFYFYLFLLLHLLCFGAFQMVAMILLASLAYLFAFKSLTRDFTSRLILPGLIFLILLVPLLTAYFGLYTASERSATPGLWLEGSFSPSVVLNFIYPFAYRYGDSFMGVILNRDFLMHEVYIYFGVSGMIIAVLGILFSKLEKQTNSLLLLFIAIFVILGFAKYNPILFAIDIPGIALFRYWGRTVILAVSAFSIFCGHFIDQLVTPPRTLIINRKNLYFLIGSAVYIILLELSTLPTLEGLSLARLWTRGDFKFDYLWLYLMFLAISLSLFLVTFRLRKPSIAHRLLATLPILELVIFGNLVLKDAFVRVDQLKTNLPNLESTYANQRIIVTDADVIGNKTLYYNFWSPFGYTSSLNKDYNDAYKSIGFESTRRSVLLETVTDGFNNTNLQSNLKSLGVVAVTNSLGSDYFKESKNPLIYPKNPTSSVDIIENYRSQEQHGFTISTTADETMGSYIKYDAEWKAVVNNQPTKIIKDGLFLGFAVPAGSNLVDLKYIPHTLYLSLAFVIVGIIFVLLIHLATKKYPSLKYFLLLSSLFIALRLPGLGTDMLNSDGARWHRRSERFMQAIKTGDFASTYQHYQPGVTLMWLNSATKKVIWEVQDVFQLPRWSLENAQDFPNIHAVSKTVLVLVLSALLLYQMAVVSKVASLKVALIYGLLVSTEPYLIGIDRWFHLTSLESYFAFSAFLTFLYALNVNQIRIYFLAGVLASLSVLSKLTGFVVLPLMIFMKTVHAYYAKNIKRSVVFIGALILGSIVTFILLFPALWVDFFNVVQKLTDAVVGAVESDTRAQFFKPPFSYIYYPVILAYKLSPTALFAFLGSLVVFVRHLKRKEIAQGRLVLAYLLTFLLILTIATKKIDRYALALVQPILLFISVYLARLKARWLMAIFVLQIILSGFGYYKHFPAISSYYSPLFGGSKTALSLGVYENSGEYFAQSAFYLNSLGRVDVYVPDNYESFKYFYYGTTLRDFSPSAKYAVTSVDFDRINPRVIPGCSDLVKTFGPKFSIPAVYIYACQN